MNPLDYIYRSLRCKIELLKEEELEAQYILRYALNTAGRGRWGKFTKTIDDYKVINIYLTVTGASCNAFVNFIL